MPSQNRKSNVFNTLFYRFTLDLNDHQGNRTRRRSEIYSYASSDNVPRE